MDQTVKELYCKSLDHRLRCKLMDPDIVLTSFSLDIIIQENWTSVIKYHLSKLDDNMKSKGLWNAIGYNRLEICDLLYAKHAVLCSEFIPLNITPRLELMIKYGANPNRNRFGWTHNTVQELMMESATDVLDLFFKYNQRIVYYPSFTGEDFEKECTVQTIEYVKKKSRSQIESVLITLARILFQKRPGLEVLETIGLELDSRRNIIESSKSLPGVSDVSEDWRPGILELMYKGSTTYPDGTLRMIS